VLQTEKEFNKTATIREQSCNSMSIVIKRTTNIEFLLLPNR